MSAIYTTADDAIEQIIDAIEAGGNARAEEYDLDAILRQAYEYSPELGGFVLLVDHDAFWTIVAEAER